MSFREFINEIKITKSDSEKYEIKDGIIHITKKEFDKISKDKTYLDFIISSL